MARIPMHKDNAKGRNKCACTAGWIVKMGVLNTSDLQAGMILARPAVNRNGTVMLGPGSALTEKHINLFKTWGVVEVDIEGIDSDQMEKEGIKALSPEAIEAIQQKLDEMFPPFENNLVMREIYKVVKKITLKNVMQGTESTTDGNSKH